MGGEREGGWNGRGEDAVLGKMACCCAEVSGGGG